MQAVGMVNDHAPDCFRYKPLSKPWKCLLRLLQTAPWP